MRSATGWDVEGVNCFRSLRSLIPLFRVFFFSGYGEPPSLPEDQEGLNNLEHLRRTQGAEAEDTDPFFSGDFLTFRIESQGPLYDKSRNFLTNRSKPSVV